MQPPSSPDPFSDPTTELDPSATLTVDRNATLRLGTDSLIVLDDGLRHRRTPSTFCGLLPQLAKTTRAVPFYNILWATLSDFELLIHYAQPYGKNACRTGVISYTVTDKSLHAHSKRWVEALLNRAYPTNTKRRQRVKVLVNPFGGKGHAQKLWSREAEPIFAAAGCEVSVERTAYKGHAIDIAANLDVNAYDLIACASGDGLPHEVFNGLAKQPHPRHALHSIAVTQIPCGSGNAMSLNLNGTDSPSLAALAIVKGVRAPFDLVAITQGKELYYSFLSQSVGIIAESDLGTESLRWMGSLRFTWGCLVRLLGQTIYPAEVSVVVELDDKRAIKESYARAVAASSSLPPLPPDTNLPDSALPALRFGTIATPLPKEFITQDLPTLGNFYAGNMCTMSASTPFFPYALSSDALLDLINIDGRVPRSIALRMLTTVEHGTLIDFPEVAYRKVVAYRISPRVHRPVKKGLVRAKVGRWLGGGRREGFISVDGEKVPFEPFQAEVVGGLGMVVAKRGGVYEYDPPRA